MEPKESPLWVHDIRVRTLAEKLGDGRGLRYTLPQLWYAASRKHMPDLGKRFFGRRLLFSIPILVVAFFSMVSGAVPPLIGIVVGIGAVVLVNLALTAYKPRFLRTSPVRMPATYDKFRDEVLSRWIKVYGGPPPGSVSEAAPPPPAPPQPRFAVLCADRAVLACLAANNVAARGIALASRPEQLPQRVPVLILHDASVPGVTFAAEVRAALGSRAIDVGIGPRALLGKEKAFRLRDGLPAPADLERLRATVSPPELAWLADGWWSPLAAVPPAKLLAAVDSATRRAEEATDPDRRRAREVGFLTWPTG
ncbi:hypothetical protein [Nocardia bovistercoris]|uniref:Uncharacterized protein n=1 Tax=Nocardia bovistercoris TaxID=2785916 RepID=A0A931IHG0_9NOCA|nr:hypothetical protein [Nocardia bovistercoris]MBH0781466.1 hypothetical protein [Nocardia bovistercoris]